jgi:hypothetical protein
VCGGVLPQTAVDGLGLMARCAAGLWEGQNPGSGLADAGELAAVPKDKVSWRTGDGLANPFLLS